MAIRKTRAHAAPETSIAQRLSDKTRKANAPLVTDNDIESLPAFPTREQRRRRLTRIMSMGCLGLALTVSSGCSIFGNATKALQRHDCIDDFMVGHRQKVLAARAWHRQKACMKNHCHLDEVKRGFMDAYMEVADGGNGCVPAVAPRDYWGWRYQSTDGSAAVNSWFEGYPLGVKAAEQDGVGHHNHIQTSSFSTQTAARTPGTMPVPALGSVAGGNPTGEVIQLPEGYINANGDFVDKSGKVTGKATVEDRAVGSGQPAETATDVVAPEVDTEVTPAAEALDRLQDDLSSNAELGEAFVSDRDAYTADFSDRQVAAASSTSESTEYQLDEPSKEDIDAVIDDIFGKPQSETSSDADDTDTFQSIPFTFE